MRHQSLSGADADRSLWAHEAPTVWSEALAILDRLHHPGVSLVRTKFWPSLPVSTSEYENTRLLAAVEGLREVRDPNTTPAAKTQRLRSTKGNRRLLPEFLAKEADQRSGCVIPCS
jgi:hypothetical protein